MLDRPEAFEPLTERGWDEVWARETIRALVERIDEPFDPDRLSGRRMNGRVDDTAAAEELLLSGAELV